VNQQDDIFNLFLRVLKDVRNVRYTTHTNNFLQASTRGWKRNFTNKL